ARACRSRVDGGRGPAALPYSGPGNPLLLVAAGLDPFPPDSRSRRRAGTATPRGEPGKLPRLLVAGRISVGPNTRVGGVHVTHCPFDPATRTGCPARPGFAPRPSDSRPLACLLRPGPVGMIAPEGPDRANAGITGTRTSFPEPGAAGRVGHRRVAPGTA